MENGYEDLIENLESEQEVIENLELESNDEFLSVLKEIGGTDEFEVEVDDEVVNKKYNEASDEEKRLYLEQVILELKDKISKPEIKLNDDLVNEYLKTHHNRSLDDFNDEITDTDYLLYKYLTDSGLTPENITDEIQEEFNEYLESVKGTKSYNKLLASAKNQYELDTEKLKLEAEKEAQIKQEESTRNTILEVVKASKTIDRIGKAQLTNDDREVILSRLFDKTNEGVSQFYKDVFDNPSELFKAAYWYYYGDNMVNALESSIKKETINNIKSKTSGKQLTTPQITNNVMSVEDLYD